VELSLAGGAYIPAAPGASLAQNTVISTGFRSSALIEVGSALIAVRPLTRMTLTEISAAAGAEVINVNLQTGRVRVDVNPPPGTRTSMSIISPMAVASVRGTSFEFDTRNLNVVNGTVGFRGSQGPMVSVDSGFSIVIGEEGRAVNPMAPASSGLIPQQPPGSEQSTEPVTAAAISDVQERGGTGFVLRW